jgi:hypothetical protein
MCIGVMTASPPKTAVEAREINPLYIPSGPDNENKSHQHRREGLNSRSPFPDSFQSKWQLSHV